MKTPPRSYSILRVALPEIGASLLTARCLFSYRATSPLVSIKAMCILSFFLITGMGVGNVLQAQQTFSRVYGQDRSTQIKSVIETQEGDVVLMGEIDAASEKKEGFNADLWIMKTDPEGNPRWSKRLRSPENETAYDLLETRDGNLVILGAGKHPETGYPQALVIQLNGFGELMWFRRFGGEVKWGDRLRDVEQTRDGGYVLTGYTHSYSDSVGQQDIWLLRLNASGEVLWQKALGSPKAIETGYRVREGMNGRLLIGGAIEQNSVNGEDMLAVETDKGGKVEWTFFLPSTTKGKITDLQQTLGGDWLCVGYERPQGMHVRSGTLAYMWKLSTTGELLWSQGYDKAPSQRLSRLVPDGEGGWTAMGSVFFPKEPPHADRGIWLLGVDEEGQITWESQDFGGESRVGYDVFPLRKGGYLIGGTTFARPTDTSFFRRDLGYLTRTDRRGRYGIGASGVLIDEHEQEFTLTEPLSTREERPRLLMLSIGISRFFEQGWDLRFAASDAEKIAQYTQETPGQLYSEVLTRSLTDTLATRENILAGLDWLAYEANPEDLVLIYLSTHGVMDLSGQVHFLPYDFRTDRWDQTGLDMYALQMGMEAIAGKKVFMLDACHSAASGSNLLETPQAQQLNQSLVSGLSIDPNLTLLTAANGEEFAFEDERWGQSAFAKALVEAWEGAADYDANRVISLYELNFYLLNRVKDLTRNQQHPSMPINLFGDVDLLPVSP